MCTIDNDIYNKLGDRWYTAYDDPVALLRAETELTNPWIIQNLVKNDIKPNAKILDVGCGGGFHTNKLAKKGFTDITGVDISRQSLEVAEKFDSTKTVKYIEADAYSLPFDDNVFDVVISIDFLEHVDKPEMVIKEISRVTKKGGVFFFHTFNRNWLSWLVIIKFVEWFVKNTPKNMHVLSLFIKPKELKSYLSNNKFQIKDLKGTKINFLNTSFIKGLVSGSIPKDLSFSFTKSLKLSYIGYAQKI